MDFNRSKGISEIIAIILAVVLTLVAFGVAYTFVFSTLGRSSSGPAMNIQGTAVAHSTHSGVVAFTFFNTGSAATSSISFSGVSCSLTWVVSPYWPVIDSGSSGTASASGCTLTAGSTIVETFTITYVNGATVTQLVDLVPS